MDDHFGPRKRLHQVGFDGIAHGMGTGQTHCRIELEMQLNEGVNSGHAGTQIMQIGYILVTPYNLPNTVPVLIGQFTVHELIVGLPKHMQRAQRQ